jgi:hypothetical protein
MPSLDEASGVIHLIDTKAIEEDFRASPQIANQELNRASQGIGGAFGRRFTAERLSGEPGITVKRRGRRSSGGPGQPSIPRKMRAAGFKATIQGRKEIDGKRLIIATRSPSLLTHELGLTIRSKSPLGMAIPFSKRRKLPPQEEAKRKTEVRRRGNLLVLFETSGLRQGMGVAFYKRSVTEKARLGFLSTWDASLKDILERLGTAVGRVVRRLGHAPVADPGAGGGEG